MQYYVLWRCDVLLFLQHVCWRGVPKLLHMNHTHTHTYPHTPTHTQLWEDYNRLISSVVTPTSHTPLGWRVQHCWTSMISVCVCVCVWEREGERERERERVCKSWKYGCLNVKQIHKMYYMYKPQFQTVQNTMSDVLRYDLLLESTLIFRFLAFEHRKTVFVSA